MGLTVNDALTLAKGPAAAIADVIAAATTEEQLAEVRLAICAHPETFSLGRQFAARRSQIRHSAAKAARDAVPAVRP